MPDYKSLYFKLFGEMAKAIEQLEKIQQNVEQEYIEMNDISVKLLKNDKASDCDERP